MNKELKTILNVCFGMFIGVLLVSGGLKAEWLHSAVAQATPEAPAKARKVAKAPKVLEAKVVEEPALASIPVTSPKKIMPTMELPREVKKVVQAPVEVKPEYKNYTAKLEKKKNPISVVSD